MTQLYEYQKRRNGGKTVGHFHEAWKEDLVIMMEYLTLEEVISFSSHFGFENRSLIKIKNQTGLTFVLTLTALISTVDKIYSILDNIADMAYDEWGKSPDKMDAIISHFKKIAKKRGYKEQD